MDRRTIVIFASLWTFFGVPHLCMTGMISHPCDQHGSQDCEHESDCSDDPCAKFTATNPKLLRPASVDRVDQPLLAVYEPVIDLAVASPHLVPPLHPPRPISPATGDRLPLLV